MTPEEIKVEEDKVRELSTFLNEHCIPSMIKLLSRNEHVPVDSETLKEAMHSNGINMRYLGRLADEIKDKNLKYVQHLLEREVVLRVMKHIMN